MNAVGVANDECNPYEGIPTALQLREDISMFLKRCLPSRTPSSAGPWICIANPRAKQDHGGDWGATVMMLKERMENAKRVLDSAPLDMGTGADVKQQFIEDLKRAISAAAIETKVTVGKWMLFPDLQDADSVWSRVAHATYKGELGISAKIATNNGSGKRPVCCVYTYNFWDIEDVKRGEHKVLVALDNLGLCKGWPITYKPDIYTYLGLYTGNEYQIPPTIYNSRDMLESMSGGCLSDLMDTD